MLSFSKAKVGRHWASKFDLLIPDLTCFQCQAPSQNFQTNVTTTTKTIRMGTCLKKEYICVNVSKKIFLDLGIHNTKCKYWNYEKNMSGFAANYKTF